MGLNVTFGQYIRGLRLQNGITLDGLAHRIGISRSYLTQLEADYMPPVSGHVLSNLAEVLGEDASTLTARAVRDGIR